MRLHLTLFLGVLAALAIVWGTAPAAKAHAPAARRREAYVDVGVATPWVQPRTNRPIDKPAVSDPSDVRLWQKSMSTSHCLPCG
jgi:gamma-D-glutamyl-L-lysine dipeptidyl-peptidase